MPKQFFFNENTIYRMLAAFFAVLFLHLAWVCYFSDSEIWLITLSEQVFSQHPPHAIYFKFFFHFLNKLAIFPAQNNVQVYYISRILFAAIGLAAAWLQAVIVSKIFANKNLLAPTFLFLMTASLFFNQAFRVRADILSLLVFSLIFLLVLQWSEVSFSRVLTLSALQVLLILTTPKAAIWTLLLLVWTVLLRTRTTNKQDLQRVRLLSLSIFGPLQIILMAICVLMFLNPRNLSFLSAQSAIDFYFKSFRSDLGGADYFHKMDFFYLYRFFIQNWFHSLLFIFWLGGFLLQGFFSRAKNSLIGNWNVLSALLIVLVLLYNQKLPFFLGSFLAPAWAMQFAFFYTFTKKKALTRWLPALVIIGACTLCLFQYRRNLRLNNNRAQLQFVQQLEAYKQQNPQVSIYDVIGLLPQDTTYFYFIGPGDVSRREELFREIQLHPPDIYLYTFKNIFYEPLLKPFLQKNYIEYFPGVWFRAPIFRMDQEPLPPLEIISVRGKNYWLLPSKKTSVVNLNTREDISKSCLYLNMKHVPTEQNDVQWIAVPWEQRRFAFINFSHPQIFWNNPFLLFRFDTAF